NSAIEILADWNRDSDRINMTGLRFTPDQLPIWHHISQPDMLWIESTDVSSEADSAKQGIYQTLGIHSMVCLPLAVAGRPIGTLILGADETWPATEKEKRIYLSLADQVAIAMERRNLLEQAERRANQLEISSQIAQAAATILDMEELFDR